MNVCLLLFINVPDLLAVVALAAVALLFYVYVGYPLLLAALGIFFRRPRPGTGYAPSITVLIAAYNEEAAIGDAGDVALAAVSQEMPRSLRS